MVTDCPTDLIHQSNLDCFFTHTTKHHKHVNKIRYDGRAVQDCISFQAATVGSQRQAMTHTTHTKLTAPSLNFKVGIQTTHHECNVVVSETEELVLGRIHHDNYTD